MIPCKKCGGYHLVLNTIYTDPCSFRIECEEDNCFNRSELAETAEQAWLNWERENEIIEPKKQCRDKERGEVYVSHPYGHCFYEDYDGKVVIYGLYVRKSDRRKGHATELLDEVISKIRSSGYSGEIVIEAIPFDESVERQGLVRLYKNMGLTILPPREASKREFVIYIAGPYSAGTKWGVMNNILEAAGVATEIRRRGYSAIVPHLESLYHEDCIPESEWLEHGFALLRRCSAVLDFRRGRVSRGSEAECSLARTLSIPIFTEISEIDSYFETIQGDQCSPQLMADCISSATEIVDTNQSRDPVPGNTGGE